MYWTRLQILLHTYFCATCLLFLNSPNACTMYSFLYFASWGVTDQSKEWSNWTRKIIIKTPNSFMPDKILQIEIPFPISTLRHINSNYQYNDLQNIIVKKIMARHYHWHSMSKRRSYHDIWYERLVLFPFL